MLTRLSIRTLYGLALAEGEGVGTAYEYYVKRLALRSFLQQVGRPRRILIAGLPQKYGCSLDFVQLADELGATLTVADERPSAIEKLSTALTMARAGGRLAGLRINGIVVSDLAAIAEVPVAFDLVLSSETLQRVPVDERPGYLQRLLQLGRSAAVFVPNADNSAHTRISGLPGIGLDELAGLAALASSGNGTDTRLTPELGYIDLPPFPPGVTRSAEQRQQATSGWPEALAMQGLALYAHLEKWAPIALRRRQAHIVFALLRRD